MALAEKVTSAPVQTLVVAVEIEIAGVTGAPTWTWIIFEVALGFETQGILEVMLHVTLSPLFRILLENTEEFVPTLTPLIFH